MPGNILHHFLAIIIFQLQMAPSKNKVVNVCATEAREGLDECGEERGKGSGEVKQCVLRPCVEGDTTGARHDPQEAMLQEYLLTRQQVDNILGPEEDTQ